MIWINQAFARRWGSPASLNLIVRTNVEFAASPLRDVCNTGAGKLRLG